MRCGACGTELLPGKAFCHACGAHAAQQCGQCGAQVAAGFRFCPDCGHALDAAAAAPAAAAAAPVPESLAEKFRAARDLAGERKQVTVLFCDIAGSTTIAAGLDAEVYRELLDQYAALAMREIYRFEGIVNQLAGDGFMALFGAPIAHEDAPQRAVRAAVAIRDALALFNADLQRQRGLTLPARIGINTGPVVVGTVGNDLKMDYTAIGDTTNLAARLEGLAAPGTILISETTARLVRGIATLRSVGPLAVKGKAEPVAAFEVLAARELESPMLVAAERGLTPLVGREEELALLDAGFRRIAGRYAQVVAVDGDAGSGKSRLIYEFKQRLLAGGDAVCFFEGRCAALNQTVPLAPFVSMLRQYFDLSNADDEADACAKVAARLGGAAPDTEKAYPLLCRVLAVPATLPADLPLEALKQETFEAITQLMHAETRRGPVVMIVEDLHWIDESSQELLAMALARLARAQVMVVLSHRPDYRPAWRTGAAVTQLHLRPLLDGDVVRITRVLAGGALPAELEARILAKAEGSPFFAEEIIRSLLEEGFLAPDDGVVRLTRPVEEILIPGSVREVIAARLDRLSPTAKRVAQLAAVLGRQFRRGDLGRLLVAEAVDVDPELAELTRRGVIHRKSLFSDDEYRFGESLTQEVAYGSLLHRERRRVHGRVAALLEEGGGDPTQARPALIAHHYAESDDRAKAVETLLRAVTEAERAPLFRTALDLARRAWEIAEAALCASPAEARFLRWALEATLAYVRVTVLYGNSSDAEAERAALRGAELAEQLGAGDARIVLRTMHGMLLTADPARFAEGIAISEAAVREAKQSADPMPAISASRAVAWNALLDGRFGDAVATIDWVLRELTARGQDASASDMYLGARWMRLGILFASDDLAGVAADAPGILAFAEQSNNRTVQSGTTATLAQLHLARGDAAAAREWAARSLEIAEQIGSSAGVQRGQVLLLAARVGLGESVSIGDLADSLEEGVALGGNMMMVVQPLIDAYLGLGELKRAERVARLALDRAAGRQREAVAAAALADVLVRLGPATWAEAERTVDRAAALAEAINSRSVQAQALVARARLALDRDDVAVARRALERARDLGRAIGMTRYERIIALLLTQTETTPAAVSA